MKHFISILETGRVRGKVTGSLYQIKANKPVRLSDFGFSKQCNAGVRTESIKAIRTFGALGKNETDFTLLLIEGQGLNYINEYQNG